MDCTSCDGFHDASNMMTRFAVSKLIPKPPARVEIKNNLILETVNKPRRSLSRVAGKRCQTSHLAKSVPAPLILGIVEVGCGLLAPLHSGRPVHPAVILIADPLVVRHSRPLNKLYRKHVCSSVPEIEQKTYNLWAREYVLSSAIFSFLPLPSCRPRNLR